MMARTHIRSGKNSIYLFPWLSHRPMQLRNQHSLARSPINPYDHLSRLLHHSNADGGNLQ